MRKLKLQVQISVDGYIAAPNGATDWLIWSWGPEWTWDGELQQYFYELKSSIDCVLLSRKMAQEGFIGHWAGVAGNPDNPQSRFAQKIRDAHKVVFTKTLERAEWENTELAKGDLTATVNNLKNQPGKDIIAYGGASFVSALIQARLIDEYYLFVNPAVLGSGKAIFHGPQDLVLRDARPYPCGVTVLRYTPR